MSLVFETVISEGIGDMSYLVGDDAAGIAAVIDPRPDCDDYIRIARKHRVAIRHIIQTHIHEDFVSGVRQLAARVGNATIHVGRSEEDEYGYSANLLRQDDTIELGSVSLRVHYTPGHTPEHIALLASEKGRSSPYAVFTGGSLLINAVGRSDLLGPERFDEMLQKQYRTLTEFYARLDDGVIVHPTHGHGSACGSAIGDRVSSTIGYERATNKYMKAGSYEEFKKLSVEDLSQRPVYYPRLKVINTEGPQVFGYRPIAPALTPHEFNELAQSADSTVIDTRSMLEFGGGHIAGAMNIEDRGELSVWAGWMLDPGQPLALVLKDDSKLDEVAAFFWRTGFTKFVGYLVGGMPAWAQSGLPLECLPQIDVHKLHENLGHMQIVDVRSDNEWKSGRVAGAKHIYLPQLPKRMSELDKAAPTVTYCGSGYRASIAASLLKRAGFADVRNVPGSWGAWRKADLPIEK
ncbi:MAG: MBL fold metallo-hydrolase [Planctomycetaceae bacterium]|nr:MBL fold metallo-hydrolase [Planctomycetaceae bacterium]